MSTFRAPVPGIPAHKGGVRGGGGWHGGGGNCRAEPHIIGSWSTRGGGVDLLTSLL